MLNLEKKRSLAQITSGTVAANLLRFSNAAGAYFVDTDDATLAAALAAAATHHDVVEVFDSSKRMLRFAVKSVGTGETLGSEINTGTLTILTLYKITATEVNHFGTGLEVGEYFTSAGAETCDANNKVKQINAPSTNGCLVQKYPGGADGFSSVDASFNHNDSSGYSWRVISSVPNGKTVYSSAITSSAMHASMVNGTAFLWDDTKDFSGFAVGPSGKYLVAMYDSSGRVAWGYGKAAGGGETLGSDLLNGWNFTIGWSPTAGVTINDADTFTSTGNGGVYRTIDGYRTAGRLFRYVVSGTTTASGFKVGESGADPAAVLVTSVNATGYGTTNGVRDLYVRNVGAGVCDITSQTLQQVLTPPATGLTITSTPDGETYNWASITTGFDANNITKIKIWRHT